MNREISKNAFKNKERKSKIGVENRKYVEKKLVSFFEFVTFFLSSSSFSRGKACDPWNEIGREGERERE